MQAHRFLRVIICMLFTQFSSFSKGTDSSSTHQIGFSASPSIDIPFWIQKPGTEKLGFPTSFIPLIGVTVGIEAKSTVSKRVTINYGFRFRYVAFIVKENFGVYDYTSPDPLQNVVTRSTSIGGLGFLNVPFNLNIYGKNRKYYFLAGIDFSFPIFTLGPARNSGHLETKVYKTEQSFKRGNIPLLIGFGVNLKKKKGNVCIEPNIQFSNFLTFTMLKYTAETVILSIGVNIKPMFNIHSGKKK